MISKSCFFMLFFGSFSSLCFAQGNTTSSYHYESIEYALDFPETWTLDTTGLLGTQFIVTSPKENDQDRFRENVSLMIQDSKNLHDFIVRSEDRIKSMGTLLESHRHINFHNQEYHVTVFTLNEQPDLFYVQYYFFKYWFIYELTYVAERKNFFKNRVTGEKVLNSFGFTIPWTY